MLGNKPHFFGMSGNNASRELGIYRKLKDCEIDYYLVDLELPNLVTWYDKVQVISEVKLVNCSICKREIRGDFRTKAVIGDYEGYVCSGKCRLSLLSKVKVEKRKADRMKKYENLKSRFGKKTNGDTDT